MKFLFRFQYLNSTDYDGKKSEEVGKLELTILQLKKVGDSSFFTVELAKPTRIIHTRWLVIDSFSSKCKF